MTSFQAKLYSPWFRVHPTAILSASTWNQKIIYHFFYWEANRTILILPISAQNIKMGDEDTKTANGTKVKK